MIYSENYPVRQWREYKIFYTLLPDGKREEIKVKRLETHQRSVNPFRRVVKSGMNSLGLKSGRQKRKFRKVNREFLKNFKIED